LAKRLWGDWYYSEETNAFTKNKTTSSSPRSFVQFILDPIYKIYSHVIGETPKELTSILFKLGVKLTSAEIHLDPKPLLKVIMSRFLGYPRGLVQMCVQHVDHPMMSAASKVALTYSGDASSNVSQCMMSCKSDSPLMIDVVKLYNSPDGQ
jgi:U5 small nuclear ribonucleoprotein component